MLAVRELRAEVVGVRREAGSVTLKLRPGRRWSGFAAGQYVQIGVVVDGVRHTRCYSPVDSQHRRDGHIELTVRAHPEGLVSQHLYRTAAPGLVLDLKPADGVFRLPEPRPERTLLISGGSGITPVLSMLRTLLDEGYPGQVAFLHYARDLEHVPHRAELARLAERPNLSWALAFPRKTPAVRENAGAGRNPESWATLEGRFGLAHLEAIAPWFAQAQTYLCGPPGLQESARELFARLRIGDRLHTEEFTPASFAAAGPAAGRVRFTGSGIEVDNSGAGLLEQAEAAGLSPAHGCRMGICMSCTAVKTSGCTRNLRTGELDSDPDRHIQICINAPVGDVAVQI
ncbi:MAG: ferredoxin reductase [Mycobacteriaceae bacterium]|nr:ferredoxin reductase [Mycobacteriaceae bacterium]